MTIALLIMTYNLHLLHEERFPYDYNTYPYYEDIVANSLNISFKSIKDESHRMRELRRFRTLKVIATHLVCHYQ